MKNFRSALIFANFLVTYSLAIPLIPNYSHPKYPQARLSLLDWQGYSHTEPEGPGTYAFGYDIEEPENDNVQFRHEERHSNGTVVGSYGFVTPDGDVHIINYVADNLGYRASTETRRRGSVKPVVFNEEQDIRDAIEAANYVKNFVQPVYTNRYQDYKLPKGDFKSLNSKQVGNPRYIQEKYNNVFNNQQQRNDRRLY